MEMERMARANRPLETVEDLSFKSMQKLQEAGFTTIGSVLAVGMEGLTAVPSIGPKTAEKILITLREVLDAPLAPPEPPEEEAIEAAAPESGGESAEDTTLIAEAQPGATEEE
jgi:hypothetical protein